MGSERRIAIAATLAAAAVGLAAWAPAASAVSVTFESPVGGETGAIVEVDDDESVANDITVAVEGDRVVVTDAGAIQVRALVGCEGRLAGRTVTCPVPALVRVNALAGNDRVTVTGVDAALYGGDGDDTLTGGRVADGQAGADTVTGTDGDDDLTGGPGLDVVSGGGGNDRFHEGDELEADRFDGGAGADVLDYTGRPTPVVADLGVGTQSAGAAGEGDVVAGFERVVGGAGNDVVRVGVPSAGPGPQTVSPTASVTPAAVGPAVLATGNRGADTLTLDGAAAGLLLGGSGDDRLTGAAGADELRGGTGADRLAGAAGDDRLFGETGTDRLAGGAGADQLLPGTARDTVTGGAGRDRIVARDGSRDRLDGGAGRDRATTDRVDRVRRVETVRSRR